MGFRKMTPAEQAQLDAMLQKIEDERKAELAEDAKSTASKEDAFNEYKMLSRWSRKGIIRKVSDSSTFWTKGDLMTKLEPSMVNALVKYGYATLSDEGWTLTLIKGVKS